MRRNTQNEVKVYIPQDGSIRIPDPDTGFLPLLKQLIPGFSIESMPPSPGYIPNFQRLRRRYVHGVNIDDLDSFDSDKLRDIHDRASKADGNSSTDKKMANLLELKEELARRLYLSCTLCPLECGVNRFKSMGTCKLNDKAYFSSIFTHISEEAVINPAVNIKLLGCSMECSYCHTWENLSIESQKLELKVNMWKDMDFENAKTLEFVGGEPVVNLLAILEVLNFAPYSFNLPIVWNTNGYMSNTASSLLQGVIDVYLPDLKYGNDACANKLSGVSNYSAFVQDGIKTMLLAGISTIVRILILPGHIECCHKPAIKWLSQFKDYENLWVSVLDQYVPEHRVPEIKELNRCPVPAEIKYVENMIDDSGLKDVNKNPEGFWRRSQTGING